MVKKIVIVGGGFAGWYTSVGLQLHLPDVEITLIESPNISKLHVGESLGFDSPYAWKKMLNLDNDQELMRQTGAIYKFGVHNTKFYSDNESVGHGKIFNLKVGALASFYNQFDYPDYFEHWSKQPGDLGIMNAWLYLNKNNQNKHAQDFLDDVSDSSHFCSSTSMPFDRHNKLVLRNNDGYSYHSDAEKMIGFLKSLIQKRNVNGKFNHVVADVADVQLDEHGNISLVTLADQQTISGDIYFDCTGFGRVLAKKTHTQEWQDLPAHNNSAWICPTKYLDPEKELSCSTKFIGEDHGWRFLINLYHRQGNGYVFNDKMVDSNITGDRLDQVTKGRQLVAPRLIKWNPGIFKNTWVKNCITLGVSSGFFDPWDAPTFSEQNRDLEEFTELMKKFIAGEIDLELCKSTYNKKHGLVFDERILRITLGHGSSRRSGPYWDRMRAKAKMENSSQTFENLIIDQDYYLNQRLPFYWQQIYVKFLALTNTDLSKWNFDQPNANDLEMAKSFFEFNRARNKYIKSQQWPNAYQWLRQNRFDGATSQEIYEEYANRD